MYWDTTKEAVPVRSIVTIMCPSGAAQEEYELVSEISVSLIDDHFVELLATKPAREVKEGLQSVLKKGYVRMVGEALR